MDAGMRLLVILPVLLDYKIITNNEIHTKLQRDFL